MAWTLTSLILGSLPGTTPQPVIGFIGGFREGTGCCGQRAGRRRVFTIRFRSIRGRAALSLHVLMGFKLGIMMLKNRHIGGILYPVLEVLIRQYDSCVGILHLS